MKWRGRAISRRVNYFYKLSSEIAREGFEPPTSGLWALRALQAAPPRYIFKNLAELINLTIFKSNSLYFIIKDGESKD